MAKYYAELRTLDGLTARRVKLDIPENGRPPYRLLRPVSPALWSTDPGVSLANTDLGFLSCRCYELLHTRGLSNGNVLLFYQEKEVKNPAQ